MRRFAWLRALVALLLVVAIGAAIAVALAGFGYRWGWWGLGTGFGMLRYCVYAGGGAAALALIAGLVCLLWRRWWLAAIALLAIGIGAGATALPLSLQSRSQTAPYIHDITTDFSDPPPFIALQKTRDALPNGAPYGGSTVADQQRRSYPDIVPLVLKLPPDQAMKKAVAVAQAMGWQIAASDANQLEATATTPWFGFKDDVVIRVRPDGDGSRIDIRSASRIGTSDLGTNARRVREIIERFKQ